MDILINHVGYNLSGLKTGILQCSQSIEAKTFEVLDTENQETHFSGSLKAFGSVDQWRNWEYWTFDFTELKREGQYRVSIKAGGKQQLSQPFRIEKNCLERNILSDLLFFIKSQRITGVFEQQQHATSFTGSREGTVDTHGGWYDASADLSIVLSHLHYANFMNPQQQPLAVWALASLENFMKDSSYPNAKPLVQRAREEAVYGADTLMRLQDTKGYFYTGVMNIIPDSGEFNTWVICEGREICTHEYMSKARGEDYQAGFRQGGGFAIAALAVVARLGIDGEYSKHEYISAAKKGFDHLEQHNTSYLNDSEENIIDHYCALLAATEIYAACGEDRFLESARNRAQKISGLVSHDDTCRGWLHSGSDESRPYFHAAEEGLPLITMLRFAEVDVTTKSQAMVKAFVSAQQDFYVSISETVSNPFRYPRMYAREASTQRKRASFFMPHDNETNYWWQGESARLASLATAFGMIYRKFGYDSLVPYAQGGIDWILGKNPFDACQMQGRGRNNRNYLEPAPNAPGGVSNGITASDSNERDIAFGDAHSSPGAQWRWYEQWLPHACWLLLAVASLGEKE